MSKPHLLIVEDDEDLRTQMRWGLASDYEVLLAEDRASALALHVKHKPALVTLDLGLPPQAFGVEEGFKTLSELIHEDPSVKVIVITGREERHHAIQAIADGAYDLFHKPIQMDELRMTLRRALQVSELERENRMLHGRVDGDSFERMLGVSPCMQEVFAAVRKVATTDAPVLVVGESGSGKELVANAIHRQSARKAGPFIVINCGAIPESLLESELFGHEKGAFTGAHVQRRGRIELAHRGTLFLDEIGELSLGLQVKLLRFLQERQIERVGGRESIEIDARVLAATNVDLQQAMGAGRFREDLYYRLGVVTIRVPSLRERGSDVALMARAFLERHCQEQGKRITGFTSEGLRALEAHEWPGNVRELDNRIKRAVIMADGPQIRPADLELARGASAPETLNLKEARSALERDLVEKALARNQGNMSKAATELGISRPTLYEMMERLGIRR